jgi:hypothetical protein
LVETRFWYFRLSARIAGSLCFSPRLKSRSSESSMAIAAKIGRPVTSVIALTGNVRWPDVSPRGA